MWDSVFAHQEDLSSTGLLPKGTLWRVDRWKYDGSRLQLEFRENAGSLCLNISFEPVYFSAADEFVEAFGGMESREAIRWKRSGARLQTVKQYLSANVPDGPDYENLTAYQVSAMEWTLRFACCEPPVVTELRSIS